MTTRAIKGNLWYGPSRYPIHEEKLPEVDFDPIIEAVKRAVKKASNFEARGPITVECRIAGNGWDVEFEVGLDELLAAVRAEREGRS